MKTIDAASASACFAAIATHIFRIYVTINGTVVIATAAAVTIVVDIVIVIEARTRIFHQFHLHYIILLLLLIGRYANSCDGSQHSIQN